MNFINIHLLRTLPLSNVNRDDTGSPKSVVFGSVPRTRISSQSRKRHVRVAFEATPGAESTYRSKKIARVVADRALDAAREAGAELSDKDGEKVHKKVAKDLATLTSKSDQAKDALIWIAESEVAEMAAKAAAKIGDVELTPEDVLGTDTSSLSIAAFGRFFATAKQAVTDGAVQVAHGFTTHRRTVELDYFTAVDDIEASFGEHNGAGHLDVAEYSSGVFYEFCSIDIDQLRANWVGRDAPDAEDRLAELVRSLLVTVPKGKQNSTAPHTFPAAALVVQSRQPLSYASAFEQAVPDSDDGHERMSVARLSDFHDRVVALDPNGVGDPVVTGTSVDDAAPLDEVCQRVARMVLDR